MRKKIGICLVCMMLVTSILVVFPIENVKAAGNTYYVSITGNDNNLGTLSSPWRTIQKAMNTAIAGDTVLVAGGNYGETLTWSKSGTASGYITIKAQTSTKPVTGAIDITGSYLILDGFSAQNAAYSGIEISGGHHVTVKNCYTKNTGWSGIRADNRAHDIVITYNYIDSPVNTKGSQEALSLEGAGGGIYNFEVSHNTVYSTKKEGIDAKVGCYNGIICYNDVYSQMPDIYIDNYGASSHDIDVYGNNCHGTGDSIRLGFEQTASVMSNIKIYNNILKSSTWGISENGDNSASHGEHIYIYNNVFDGGCGFRIHMNTGYVDVVVRNNIFSCGSIKSIKSGNDVTWSNNFESGDPKWVNPSSIPDGYKLQAGSPCINAGISDANSPLTDYYGCARVGAVDIGAFEYGSTKSTSVDTTVIPQDTTVIPQDTTVIPQDTTVIVTDTGNTYYVSTTGNDNNAGTLASPWRTIQKAANTVNAGTVYVRGGTYKELVTITSDGTSNSPITFKNYQSEVPIIDGTGKSLGGNGVVTIGSGASYIVFDGFTVQNSAYIGIRVHGSNHITVQNCKVYYTDYSSIRVEGSSSYVKVYNSYFYGEDITNVFTFAISASTYVEAKNNHVINSYKGIDCVDGSSHITISGNDVETSEYGICADPYGADASDYTINGNYVHGSASGAFWLGNPKTSSPQGDLTNVYLYNNIAMNTGNGVVTGYNYNCVVSNIQIINNDFNVGNIGIQLGTGLVQSVIVRNNIIKGSINYKSGSTVTQDHNFLLGDPKWVSSTDYHLQSTSPCINAGISTNAPTTDYDNGARVGAVDIGAFEYGSTKSTSVDTTVTPQDTTVIPQDTTVIPQDTTVIPQDTTVIPQDTTVIPQDTTVIPQDTTLESKNNPVNKPTINGKINGRPGREYVYKFVSTDPDADDVTYCINWGDGTKEVRIGPTQSGIEAYATHTWFKKGNYIIKAKAIDAYGAESDWATFKVSISNAHINNPINHLFLSIVGIFSFFLIKY